MFELIREDWQNHHRTLMNRGMWVMVVYRFGNWRYSIRNRFVRVPFSAIYKFLFVVVQCLTSVELPCETKTGRGFRIEHCGDIVVSGDAVFGEDCIIRNGVTVGLKNTKERGSPVLGNRVDIGAGAKILGVITIGDDVSIGANAVVLQSVPANSIAVGIPARIIPRREPLDEETTFV